MGRIFGNMRGALKGGGAAEYCIMSSLTFWTLRQTFLWRWSRERWESLACSTIRRDEKCMKNFIGKSERKRPLRRPEVRWWRAQRWFSKLWFVRHSTSVAAASTRIFYLFIFIIFIIIRVIQVSWQNFWTSFFLQNIPYITLKWLFQVPLSVLSNTNFNLYIPAKLMLQLCFTSNVVSKNLERWRKCLVRERL